MDSTSPKGALAFCNEVRAKLGRLPVPGLRKGYPHDEYGCVVGATINYGSRYRAAVDIDRVTFDQYSGRYEGPAHVADTTPAIRAFIQDFDLGALPEFVGKGWAE